MGRFLSKKTHWLKDKSQNFISKVNLNENLLVELDKNNRKFNSIICDPIEISGAKNQDDKERLEKLNKNQAYYLTKISKI